ncbi:putative choloylglycine hydrolase [Gracilibacillus halotolerans]|uniref:Putative choloylglycine hydrolase n=1 Tax=Gracilibacillus halotolerans TaxID=74386 RepID=A0A841RN27_9BACI|nr:C45 family peptidase [Gracilibacillus halotolerans]MBB6512575.1 putative choloylglycine hydrolase [Gracilibacillus halotolerans]
MKKIFTNIIQFRGSHYDFGLEQGKQIKNSYIIKNRENQWKIRKPQFRIDPIETKNIFQNVGSKIWEELEGLQDALQWPIERVLLEFGGYRNQIVRSGCSILTGHDYMIRNYDYHPKTYEGRFLVYQPTDSGNASIGVSQRITGRADGMNEKGLSMGYTFIHRKRPGDGFVCHMIGRLILELCDTVEDATALLKEIPHRGSFSYVLKDTSNTDARIVEASPRNVDVLTGNHCTNHFLKQTEENRHYLEDSKRRYNVLETETKQEMNAKEAYYLLNDLDKGLFSTDYRNWAGTIHTSAYFPTTLSVWFALGNNKNPSTLDFSSWVQGKDFDDILLSGEIDTDIPFLHMERADWFHN